MKVYGTLALTTKAEELAVEDCELEGALSSQIRNMRALGKCPHRVHAFCRSCLLTLCHHAVKLEMRSNRMAGPIPTELGLLTRLGECWFSGALAFPHREINRFLDTKTEIINLASNRLEGSIPSQLGQCTSLVNLILAINSLSGTIPTAVLGLPRLGKFSRGSLCVWLYPWQLLYLTYVLAQLQVARNMLTGSIPSEFCAQDTIFEADCAIQCECCSRLGTCRLRRT